MKFGLFYGSTTCYTEMAAEKIRDILGDELVELHDVKNTAPQKMEEYEVLILCMPTWDFGELQEDWAPIWGALPLLDLKGKVIALYGLGDQELYDEWFLDAMGMLYRHLEHSGAHFIGFWPTEGYTFNTTKPLNDAGSHFVGLALDDANQYDLTDERIEQWCQQILIEMEPLLFH